VTSRPDALPSYRMFVGGEWTESHSGRTYRVFDPALGKPLAEVAKGDREDVRSAVAAASAAFESAEWRRMDPSKRGRTLFKIAQTLRERLSEFAKLETVNNGKPFGQAKGDMAQSARHFEYFAGLADKIEGRTIRVPGDRLDYTVKEPLGVTAHIVPWNYPMVMAARSIAPALAAGNTVVAKPASFTPLTLLKFAELCKEAGLPDGVLNVVTGGGSEVGEELCSQKEVRLVTITGSVETGMRVMELASRNLARVVLELGGKNPNIVFGDADLAAAAKGILNGIFLNAGQMCWAGSRLLVSSKVRDDLLERVVAGAKSMRLGNGLEPETTMGPLVSESQRERVRACVERGVAEGAEILAGGSPPGEERLGDGYFYSPTILDRVSPSMKVAQEEIFGPVLSVMEFESDEQAVSVANGVDYGLWAGVWTKDVRRAHRVAEALESGIVAVNEEPVTFPQTPFGGFKRSGNSSEQGMEAVSTYVRVKNVSVNLS
jgi:aldehyde dehydrogenase (NAD+)